MTNLRSKPVSFDDVAQAMQQLSDEGIQCSVRLVHARLGRGSLTTISKFIQQVQRGLRVELNAHPQQSIQSLCQQLMAATDVLAAQTAAHERKQSEAFRHKLEQQLLQAEQEKHLALTQLEAEQKLRAQMSRALEQRDAALVGTEAELKQVRSNELRLTEEIGRLKSALTQAQAALSAEQQQTLNAQAKREELQALVSELSILQLADQNALSNAQAERDQAKAKHAQLTEQISQLQHELIAAQNRIEQQRVHATEQRRNVTVGLVEHAQRALQLARQFDQGRGDKDSLQELSIAQREIERLFL